MMILSKNKMFHPKKYIKSSLLHRTENKHKIKSIYYQNSLINCTRHFLIMIVEQIILFDTEILSHKN